MGDESEFKNARHLAAWAGLMPRQFTSGDCKVLLGVAAASTATVSYRTDGPNRTDRTNQ
ncbi:transposase [Methylocystis suflitae]|uniref:transposase n=1 Tax=Methylocystis suflitae TaxID=2951405 RepID=UPI003898D75A